MRCYWHDAAPITMRVESLPPPLFPRLFFPTFYIFMRACYVSICPSVRPSIRTFVRPCVHASMRPSIHPSVRPSVPQHGAVVCARARLFYVQLMHVDVDVDVVYPSTSFVLCFVTYASPRGYTSTRPNIADLAHTGSSIDCTLWY